MNLKLSRFFIIKMSLLVTSMVVLTLFSLFASPEGAEQTGSTIAVLGSMVAAVFGGGLLWSVHKYQGTQLSDAGVRQVTLRGSVFVPWHEVQAMRFFGGAYILDSPRGPVIVNPKAYEDPYAVAEFVDEHMRPVMEERGAQVIEHKAKRIL